MPSAKTFHTLLNNSRLRWIAAGVTALSLGLYFRLYPLRSYVPAEASEKAAVFVLAQARNKLAEQIKKEFPQLSEMQQGLIAKKRFDDLLHKEGPKVRETIDRVAGEIQRESRQPAQRPYLFESDSFYYYELTENIVKTGRISETIKGSKYLHPLMLAPEGHWEPLNLHPYAGCGVYRVLKFVFPDIELMYAVGFTPLAVTALALVPFLLICRLLNCHPAPAMTGAVFFLLSPIFVKRSLWGWYDNDPYNVLFPLTILTSLFYSLKKITSHRQAAGYALLCAFFTAAYAFFWHGWMFLFTTLLFAGGLILLYSHFVIGARNLTPVLFTFFAVLGLGSFSLVALTFGPKEFFNLFAEGWHALKNFLAPQLSPWPDLYITVGELKKITPAYLAGLLGGKLVAAGSLAGLLILAAAQWKNRKTEPRFEFIVLSVLSGLTVILSLGAQRFAVLCFIPLSLTLTYAVQKLFDVLTLQRWKNFPARAKNAWRGLVTVGILALAIGPVAHMNREINALMTPIYNETWERALAAIHRKTPPQSIVNTWWPPGHFIKAIAHRGVTFDGASINFPQAYWMANVFLSQDEREAAGILRMLNTSANKAAEYLTSLGIPLSTSVEILKLVAPLTLSEARRMLQPILQDKNSAAHLLTLTHGVPPPSYCLVYNEFVESNLQLSFIGHWNFKKIERINADPRAAKQIPPRNSGKYIQFLWELAGGPYKYSGPLAQLGRIHSVILFEGGVQIDLDAKTCQIQSEEYGNGIPQSIFYLEDGQVIEKKLEGANLPISALLFQPSPQYNCILLDPRLARSLLIRLYFFEGKGLKYFQPFLTESDLTGRTRILVYRVDWKNFDYSEIRAIVNSE